MARLAPTPEARDRAAASVPLRRMGAPGDVAAACLFLGSDAARYERGDPAGRRRLDPERRADGARAASSSSTRESANRRGLLPATGSYGGLSDELPRRSF